ncbi:MAG: TetR/AcrR family transcriptional regulator [Spirochaetia bacterium]|jgi:AcrR family transcriptional regulator|nr:TetR/AcrR family transcriptional regulator [Spirochaetia bacterium]
MNSKNIKSERVKRIFADTAKQIITTEGVEAVTVRDVAIRASYSFPTLYNHFKSLDELLWYTRNLMMLDIADYLKSNVKVPPVDARGIAELFRSYVDFYLEYPNCFKFFYFYQLDKPQGSSAENEFDYDFEKNIGGIVSNFNNKDGITDEKIITSLKAVMYSVHGMLMLHLSDNYNLDRAELYSFLDDITELLF